MVSLCRPRSETGTGAPAHTRTVGAAGPGARCGRSGDDDCRARDRAGGLFVRDGVVQECAGLDNAAGNLRGPARDRDAEGESSGVRKSGAGTNDPCGRGREVDFSRRGGYGRRARSGRAFAGGDRATGACRDPHWWGGEDGTSGNPSARPCPARRGAGRRRDTSCSIRPGHSRAANSGLSAVASRPSATRSTAARNCRAGKEAAGDVTVARHSRYGGA